MDDQKDVNKDAASAAGTPSVSTTDDVIHQLEEELTEMGVKPQEIKDIEAGVQPVSPKTTDGISLAAIPVTMPSHNTPTPPAPAPSSVASPAAVPADSTLPGSTPSASSALVSTPAPTPDAPESLVPPVPTPADSNTPKHHEVMGQLLANAIQKGKGEVPAEPDPMVSKPGELQSWRVFKIMSEFVEGFELLGKYGLAASVFGSARTSFASHFYDDATALAGKLAQSGFAVITGGSAGIMEAANKGAFQAGGASVGLNIRLEDNQGMNTYLTDSMTFEHFFVRKVMLTFASEVYIYFPGGFGTLDEFTEILTLVQTKKIRRIPIVLYGKEYWEPFTKVFEERLDVAYKAVGHEDLELYKVVDSVDEAFGYIMGATGGKDVR